MASTSNIPGPPNSLEELDNFFSWNPPALVLDTIRNQSTSTRPPPFFDKHLSETLILKRVQRLPTLVQDLARYVDTAVNAAINTLPPLDGFITAQQRDDDLMSSTQYVEDEKGVAETYYSTTSKYCTRVASTLALHPNASFSRWTSLLCWTRSVSHSGYAIKNGQLCFNREALDPEKRAKHNALVESMDDAIRPIFVEMGQSRSPLATWEMISPSSGPVEVMASVPNLGDFVWTTCNDLHCHEKPNHQKQIERVTQLKVGPDALTPPWNLVPHSSNTVPQPVSGSSTHLLSSLTLPCSSEHISKKRRRRGNAGTWTRKKRKKRNDNDEHALSKGKNKAPPQQGNSDNDDGPFHDISAHNLVEQAWAHAVNVDGTVIVLHSGNHELVCIRHRTSQTLYVSDLIEPPKCMNPGYGKLQVGIYLTAIQDTMDRKRQPQPGDPFSGDEDPDDQDDQDDHPSGGDRKNDHEDPGSKRDNRRGLKEGVRFLGSSGKSGPGDCDPEKMMLVASRCNLIFLYLQYNIYDSPVPASFIRSTATSIQCPALPISIRTHRPEESLTIILTSEIGHGATSWHT